jgi:hypothetical protein
MLTSLEETADKLDHRLPIDRRCFSWQTVVYGFMRSRRHGTRRDSDADPTFIDWHHPWLFFLATGIMLMSCADAFFTLALLERGAYEANPFMSAVMELSTTTFAVAKMTLTGFGILALVFLARMRFLNRVRTGVFLTCFFSCYATLICYEFLMLISTM